MSAHREISADRSNEIHELARNVARTMRAAKHAKNTGDEMAAANVMGGLLDRLSQVERAEFTRALSQYRSGKWK